MIQILGLLSVYFDAVVVEVETFLLLFRLTLAILCSTTMNHFFYDLTHLEARAEIQKYFRSFFGSNEDIQRSF